ncbi:MAG: ABC transporter ATP-binding protein, partial [Acidimicrobiia bacterium]|nr:ABC transporter ATP-binding protein [Acidimicrobiia bacterium]
MSIVVARDLTQRFGAVTALDALSLTVEPGVTGLVGANGAGKTTLLRIMLGLVHPTSGSITVFGTDARTDPLAVRATVGYMPEGNCIPKDQTAADFVAFAAQLAGVPPKDARRRASETLFLVGLEEERFRFLGDFSTGMQQRVKLAQSIVHGPKLVLLDEPASGLDPAGREQMLALIRRLGGFGINVIVSSHVLTDIEETCTRVVMLDAGKLIRSGDLAERRSDVSITVEVMGAVDGFARDLVAAGLDVSVTGNRVAVVAPDDQVFDIIRDSATANGIGIFRMGRRSVSLEDEFLDSAG